LTTPVSSIVQCLSNIQRTMIFLIVPAGEDDIKEWVKKEDSISLIYSQVEAGYHLGAQTDETWYCSKVIMLV
jgi:hypothetical protein